MRGKEKCNLLKSIRIRLAEVNNIAYSPHPCNNTDECLGTCEMCDKESLWLLHALRKKEEAGFPVSYTLSSMKQIHAKFMEK